MNVIRGAKIEGSVILSPLGEVHPLNEKVEVKDLFEEETKKAFSQGFENGSEEGYERAIKETGALLTLLQTIVKKVLEQKEKLLEQLKPEVIEFALKVSERIIRKELSQPEVFATLIHSLLSASRSNCKEDFVTVFISQDDLKLLEESNRIDTYLKTVKEVRFVSDPLMRRGDVRLENSAGLLHYDISRELADLQSKVLQT